MMIETFYDYYTDTVFTDNRLNIKDIFKEINQMVLVGLPKKSKLKRAGWFTPFLDYHRY